MDNNDSIHDNLVFTLTAAGFPRVFQFPAAPRVRARIFFHSISAASRGTRFSFASRAASRTPSVSRQTSGSAASSQETHAFPIKTVSPFGHLVATTKPRLVPARRRSNPSRHLLILGFHFPCLCTLLPPLPACGTASPHSFLRSSLESHSQHAACAPSPSHISNQTRAPPRWWGSRRRKSLRPRRFRWHSFSRG